jgi:hypothetical protein
MYRSFRVPICAVFGLLVIAFPSPAGAWLRDFFEDAQVVGRSTLIVVGAIKPGSIQYVAHPPAAGMSWEHRATLIVRRVLKGKCEQKEIPVTIHYGLTPLIGGHFEHEGTGFNDFRPGRVDPDSIQIWDTGNSAQSGQPVVEDARHDYLWLLRRRSEMPGIRWDGPNNYGVIDPEDMQPLRFEDYLMCYLAADPESAVRAQLQKQPEIADRALRYLQHCEVQRIIAESDAARRVERLIPFAFREAQWGFNAEARKAIVEAGSVGGPYLMGVFQDTRDSQTRQDVIRLWGQIRYDGCVDTLAKLLEDHDQFWGREKLEPGWWKSMDGSAHAKYRNDMRSETYYAVWALGEIGDSSATEAVRHTRRRWPDMNLDDHQIVDECDSYLARIGAPSPTTAPATQGAR